MCEVSGTTAGGGDTQANQPLKLLHVHHYEILYEKNQQLRAPSGHITEPHQILVRILLVSRVYMCVLSYKRR